MVSSSARRWMAWVSFFLFAAQVCIRCSGCICQIFLHHFWPSPPNFSIAQIFFHFFASNFLCNQVPPPCSCEFRNGWGQSVGPSINVLLDGNSIPPFPGVIFQEKYSKTHGVSRHFKRFFMVSKGFLRFFFKGSISQGRSRGCLGIQNKKKSKKPIFFKFGYSSSDAMDHFPPWRGHFSSPKSTNPPTQVIFSRTPTHA